ncbi:hypothetical protein LRS74_23235 [Streptomyces sp. LX-29]|uniref:hypothetical protein n=1 Tax=Streptomyces sp. LX-29 TaxID=2900152 RepID=UPI00240DF5CF|nr:hypothetical protein [Streptomyces sp. LX-29]WFB09633.1 hypothetical protein LRS74_23235 [Streptomyces sp. LX-29]
METIGLILLLLFVLFVVAGAYVTVRTVRAARRGIDRTVTQARRTVEDTRLRAKRYATPGAAGELAQLRLSLRTSMRATRETLEAGVAEDPALKESLALFERLSAHGVELEGELRRLEREPDRTRLAARLPELRERTERITHSADSLRWAARERAHRFASDDLADLGREIDLEAGALRHWAPAAEPDAPSGAPAGAAQGVGPRAGGTGSGAGTGAGDVPGVGGGSGSGFDTGQAGPRAIAAPEDPEWQPGHGWQRWQKEPRPESNG